MNHIVLKNMTIAEQAGGTLIFLDRREDGSTSRIVVPSSDDIEHARVLHEGYVNLGQAYGGYVTRAELDRLIAMRLAFFGIERGKAEDPA